jgi:transcriptional regulator with PAS, ATPase and Fis domain
VEEEVATLLDGEDGVTTARSAGPPRPGLVVVFVASRACSVPLPMSEEGLELGRTQGEVLADASISRRHARVRRTGGAWTITDLESSNGTFVDGVKVEGEITTTSPRVLRLGSAIFLFQDDVARFATGARVRDGLVVGPTLAAIIERVGHLARIGSSVHITGESGSGKEIVARAFHAASGRAAETFVAVNCAAIPPAIAERLFFGTKKGAFSGADADANGYVQAAHKGTLFLDEIGELDPSVQAKLLRVLETKEVLALGAVKPQAIDMRVCSATMRNLLAEVEAGRFREDLYYRIGRPAVALPPLRRRPEEIPFLVEEELARMPSSVQAAGSFLEACILRSWRGNVRELLQEVREAASLVLGTEKPVVRAEHLPAGAAADVQMERPPEPGPVPATAAVGTPEHQAMIATALAAEDDNVSGAARRLGVHRNQLRRWMTRYGMGKA